MSAISTELRHLVLPVETWSPVKEASSQPFIYVDLSSVDRDTKEIVAPQTLVGAEAPSRAKQLLETGDVLVSTVRPNLNAVALVPEELNGATGSTGFCVLRANHSELDHTYLYHWVRNPSFVASMVRRATGASYPAVSDRIVKESKIPLPPLPEQQRIAAILDKADAVHRKRQQTLDLADQFLRSTFLDMFGESDTNAEEFCRVPLGQHLQFVTSGGRGWAKYYAPEGRRFIRSLDVQMNCISDSDAVFVQPPDNAEARRTKVMNGDVLLTITGSRIGRVAHVPEGLAGSYISQHVAILRVDRESLNPTFLAYFLSLNSAGQRQIARAQYGQTKPGLNFKQLLRLQIPVPPMKLQWDFVRHIRVVERLKGADSSALSELESLFASIQQRAFRGEL